MLQSESESGRVFKSLQEGVDYIFKHLDSQITLATPLGLGKPNQLLNMLYDRAAADKNSRLKIFTALSLFPPHQSEDLAKRFFNEFSARQWGVDYPLLKYFQAAVKDQVPDNIEVNEFYFQAATALKSKHLQRHYESVNYTHVTENVFRNNINVIVQLVAMRILPNGEKKYSLSCNPDVTLDVADLYKANGKKLMIIGVVHPDLPYLGGEAEVDPSFFAGVVESEEVKHQLFALPRMPMSPEDHLIGFYSSLCIEDGGTIQIGIGSLSDAIVASLKCRQHDNARYVKMAQALPTEISYTHLFTQGLYGLTEMLTDGFMHLRQAGILKRHVIDEKTGTRTFVHGSFYLGSKDFYKWLRTLSPEESQGLRMTRISKVNDLYDPNETVLRKQRVKGRFYNTTMQVSLLGEAASDTLSDGRVLSGVGGQYNFVSMSRELVGARSVIMLRSVRDSDGKRLSNIVWNMQHATIPRHLRDMVVTEYGVADIRGKNDEECIKRLLNIADSEFQLELLEHAKKAGKVASHYEIPAKYRNNTPARIQEIMQNHECKSAFVPFPFGSDFTNVEEKILLALKSLQRDQQKSPGKLVKALIQSGHDFEMELTRMGLNHPKNLKEHIYRRLLRAYLRQNAEAAS
jgi:acyl-CoA hydrolase